MFAIIVSACLSTTPTDCQLHDLGMINTEGFKACRLMIEPAVKTWHLAHPDLILHSAYCMPLRSAPLN